MRKLGYAIAGSLLLVLLVAGCGSSGSDAPITVAEGTVNKACEGTPKRGGDLVYARQAEQVTLNPDDVLSNGDILNDDMIYVGLVRLNPEGGAKVAPAIAQSWTISPDRKTYTFKLRPNVKFSDGSPVTAEDVVFSLERFGDPKINDLLAVVATGYESAEIVNASTVRVKLSEPVAAFLFNLASFAAFVVPKQAVEEEGEAFWKHPVGAGPFKVKEFVLGSHITVERNPYYWEKGKPYLDSVRFNFATETNSRILALKNDQAQIADGIPYSQVESLQGDPELSVQQVPVPANLWMSINNKRPEFADVNVRKAMNYALDRKQMLDQILHGVGSIPNSIFPEFEIDASASEVAPYEYDVKKAKEYMAKSNFPNGFSTTLQYPSGYEYYKQMTLLMQQEFAAIGIKVKLVEQDQTTTTEKYYGGEYDLTFPYNLGSPDVPVPDEYAALYALPSTGTEGFFSFWSDPKIEKLVKKYLIAAPENRTEDWHAAQAAFWDQTPILNVLQTTFINAHQSYVCGTANTALGADSLQLTWLADKS